MSTNTAPARSELLRKTAIRATKDPVTLLRAARIVRAAIQLQKLTLDDLQGPIVGPDDVAPRDRSAA